MDYGPQQSQASVSEVFRVFLKLGLTSFGGPIAHLGYFRDELVTRRKWLSESAYADLVALCQFLPGPASSQVGFALGLTRAGWGGAFAAFLAFTLPSALILLALAMTATRLESPLALGVLHGLKIVAVAIVAQAVWGMAKNLCPDRERATIAVAAVLLLAWAPGAIGMMAAILLGTIAGLALGKGQVTIGKHLPVPVSRKAGLTAFALFAALLIGLPFLAGQAQGWALADSFYRAGSLVFGGGHVVLPLLRAETVTPGWVSDDAFLAGYGAAQAVPGPLFTFAAWLGAIMGPAPNGVAGAAIALVALHRFLAGGAARGQPRHLPRRLAGQQGGRLAARLRAGRRPGRRCGRGRGHRGRRARRGHDRAEGGVMRFRRWHRPEPYRDTSRKRAAFHRKQRLEREALPLFADQIADGQHDVDTEMARRAVWWDEAERARRRQRAATWRKARLRLFALPNVLRRTVREIWRDCPYPADPAYFADLLHQIDVGRVDPRRPPWKFHAALKARVTPDPSSFDAAFRQIGKRKSVGLNTTEEMERLFCGNLGAGILFLRSRARPIECHDGICASPGHRPSDPDVGSGGHVVEIEVMGDRPDAHLAMIARIAQAADTRPVLVRRAARPASGRAA